MKKSFLFLSAYTFCIFSLSAAFSPYQLPSIANLFFDKEQGYYFITSDDLAHERIFIDPSRSPHNDPRTWRELFQLSGSIGILVCFKDRHTMHIYLRRGPKDNPIPKEHWEDYAHTIPSILQVPERFAPQQQLVFTSYQPPLPTMHPSAVFSYLYALTQEITHLRYTLQNLTTSRMQERNELELKIAALHTEIIKNKPLCADAPAFASSTVMQNQPLSSFPTPTESAHSASSLSAKQEMNWAAAIKKVTDAALVNPRTNIHALKTSSSSVPKASSERPPISKISIKEGGSHSPSPVDNWDDVIYVPARTLDEGEDLPLCAIEAAQARPVTALVTLPPSAAPTKKLPSEEKKLELAIEKEKRRQEHKRLESAAQQRREAHEAAVTTETNHISALITEKNFFDAYEKVAHSPLLPSFQRIIFQIQITLLIEAALENNPAYRNECDKACYDSIRKKCRSTMKKLAGQATAGDIHLEDPDATLRMYAVRNLHKLYDTFEAKKDACRYGILIGDTILQLTDLALEFALHEQEGKACPCRGNLSECFYVNTQKKLKALPGCDILMNSLNIRVGLLRSICYRRYVSQTDILAELQTLKQDIHHAYEIEPSPSLETLEHSIDSTITSLSNPQQPAQKAYNLFKEGNNILSSAEQVLDPILKASMKAKARKPLEDSRILYRELPFTTDTQLTLGFIAFLLDETFSESFLASITELANSKNPLNGAASHLLYRYYLSRDEVTALTHLKYGVDLGNEACASLWKQYLADWETIEDQVLKSWPTIIKRFKEESQKHQFQTALDGIEKNIVRLTSCTYFYGLLQAFNALSHDKKTEYAPKIEDLKNKSLRAMHFYKTFSKRPTVQERLDSYLTLLPQFFERTISPFLPPKLHSTTTFQPTENLCRALIPYTPPLFPAS